MTRVGPQTAAHATALASTGIDRPDTLLRGGLRGGLDRDTGTEEPLIGRRQ
jgi:hypothetical protein